MYINIPRKENGLPLLYKSDIEKIAELYLEDFNPRILKEPMPTPIDEFLENYLKLDMDYVDITPDASVLGLTAFDSGFITVYDSENKRDRDIYVKEGTVIIDNTLLSEEQEGRCRFTCGHEAGHWILHRKMFKSNKNRLSIFDMINNKEVKCLERSFEKYPLKRTFTTDDDWMEWHANFMASCLLMPRKTFKVLACNILERVGINEDYIVLGKDFEINEFADEMSKVISKIFNVSMQAASIRLRQLRIVREKTAQLAYC